MLYLIKNTPLPQKGIRGGETYDTKVDYNGIIR